MNNHHAYLKAMEIDLWQDRNRKPIVAEEAHLHNISKKSIDQNSWEKLQNTVSQCTLCDLHKTRKNTVFGVGNSQADLLIIGEAPGANEDIQGKPFVGRAGMLLNSMLISIGLNRDDIFIANILKCRPPNNRDPLPHEVTCCTPYLKQQIAMIQPKLIVAVGRIAAHFLLDTNEPLGKLRGKTFTYSEQKVPLMVTYHPAYLLRSPREKAKAYVDVLKMQQLLQGMNPSPPI